MGAGVSRGAGAAIHDTERTLPFVVIGVVVDQVNYPVIFQDPRHESVYDVVTRFAEEHPARHNCEDNDPDRSAPQDCEEARDPT